MLNPTLLTVTDVVPLVKDCGIGQMGGNAAEATVARDSRATQQTVNELIPNKNN